jgi:hypothetical protein
MRSFEKAIVVGSALALAVMPGRETQALSEEQAEIAGFVSEAVGYWEEQGDDLDSTELVLVDENEIVLCGPDILDAYTPTPFHCWPTHEIVFSERAIERLSDKPTPRTATVYAAYHEVSHAVQAERGLLGNGDTPPL